MDQDFELFFEDFAANMVLEVELCFENFITADNVLFDVDLSVGDFDVKHLALAVLLLDCMSILFLSDTFFFSLDLSNSDLKKLMTGSH